MVRHWTFSLLFVCVIFSNAIHLAAQQPHYQQSYYQPQPAPQMQRAQMPGAYRQAAAQMPAPAIPPAVDRRAMNDVHRMMIDDSWQRMRTEANARLAQKFGASPQAFPRTNQDLWSAPPRYANQPFVRRYPPANLRSPQSASQDDPFGEVQEDPFGDQPQDPFGDPPTDNPPQQQQPDPFGEGQPQDPDPFGQQQPPQQQDPFQTPPDRGEQLDPFADPPMTDPTPTQPQTQTPTQPTPPNQQTDPRLPGGNEGVPEVPRETQELPVPPETQEQPPGQVEPPSETQPRTTEPAQVNPQEPGRAPSVRDARPITSPDGQLYPGQIPPSPYSQAPKTEATPYPYGTYQAPTPGTVGSPSPYMPPANYGQAPSFAPTPGYAPAPVYAAPATPGHGISPPIVGPGQAVPSTPTQYPPIVQGNAMPYSDPGAANQIYPGQLPSVVEGRQAMPDTIDGCSTCAAFEEQCPQFYLSIFGGVEDIDSLTSTTGGSLLFDEGEAFGVALGAIQGYNLRTDLEFTYRSSDVLSTSSLLGGAKVDSYTGMTNAYWEFMSVPNGCWKPYIGGGIGFGIFETTVGGNTTDDSAFAYQYMLGLNYKYSPTLDLFGEWRKLHADDISLNGTDVDFESDNYFVGLRLKF